MNFFGNSQLCVIFVVIASYDCRFQIPGVFTMFA